MHRAIALSFAALLVVAPPLAAQNVYEDPEGRFALDLPQGWTLQSEQLNQLYTFGASGAPVLLILLQDGEAHRDTIFATAVEVMIGSDNPAPPMGTVFDVDVNNNPARWTKYSWKHESGRTLHGMLGGVALPGSGQGAVFFVVMNDDQKKKWAEPLEQTFASMRLPGDPLSGMSKPVAVTIDYAAEAAPPPAGTFEHELVTVAFPVGWSATAGAGAQIATLSHSDLGDLRVMGLPKNDFGKNAKEILNALAEGLKSSLPSMRVTRQPYEVATAAGETALVSEYSGSLVIEGNTLPKVALLAAMKDKRRGLGFMAIIDTDKKDAAFPAMLEILKTVK